MPWIFIICIAVLVLLLYFRDQLYGFFTQLTCKHERCKVHPVPTKAYGLFAMFNSTCLSCGRQRIALGDKELHIRMTSLLNEDTCDCSKCREIKAIMIGLQPMPGAQVD